MVWVDKHIYSCQHFRELGVSIRELKKIVLWLNLKSWKFYELTNLMPMWLYIFFVIYFCGIWAFSSGRKHLLTTLLRLAFVVLVLYFRIYFYLCNFNYSLFFVVYFLVFFCLWGFVGFVCFGFYNYNYITVGTAKCPWRLESCKQLSISERQNHLNNSISVNAENNRQILRMSWRQTMFLALE